MNRDSRMLLSLVATGRMTAAEAERWMAASREERQDRNETRWIVAVLVAILFLQAWPLLAGLRQIASLLIGRIWG
jgi:hypothetical protein